MDRMAVHGKKIRRARDSVGSPSGTSSTTHPVAVESTTLPVRELVPPIKSMDTCLSFQPLGRCSPTILSPDAAARHGILPLPEAFAPAPIWPRIGGTGL